jgi:class 3 adenylate cyclase
MSTRSEIEKAIAALEGQRPLLGDAVVDAAIDSLRKQLPDRELFIAERKWVTIMFADISGFTALSETRDPEEVRRLMNRCFDHLVPVVRKYKGTIDKYIGDEIMALFGAPVANEQHAEFGCACALEMMEALGTFNAREGLSLGLHIGMNTGLVVAGGVGSSDEQQYSVMGDAVNLGARLKDKSTNGKIYVGPDTYRMTANLFAYDALTPLELKGKAQPVPVYSLLSRKELAPFQSSRYFEQTPLIGREGEMDVLEKALHRLREGQGSVISIIAEAGIGKSRLVKECRDRNSEGLQWVEGRSLAHLEAIGYVPVQDLMRRLARRNDGPTQQQPEAAVRAMIDQYISPEHPVHAALLMVLANLEPDQDQKQFISGLDPASLRTRVQEAFIDFIRKIAEQKPLVVVWEDVHWADQDSTSLMEALALRTPGMPVCQVLLFRPEKEDLCWAMHQKLSAELPGYREIALDALTSTEVDSMIHNLAGDVSTLGGIAHMVFERTEGNPFYTEELVRAIRDKQLAGTADADIRHYVNSLLPQSFQSIVAARIDSLHPSDKLVLQTASVMGRVVDREVLQQMISPHHELDLSRSLETLLNHEMIRPFDGERPGEMIFRHAIVQEVAYTSLLMEKRRELHTRCADSLRDVYGDRQAYLVATHYEASGAWQDAVNYYERAVGAAVASYAHRDEENILCRLSGLLYRKSAEAPGKVDVALLNRHTEAAGDVCLRNLNLDEARNQFERGLQSVPGDELLMRGRLMRKMALCFDTLATVKRDEIFQWLDLASAELEKISFRDSAWWTEWIDLQLDRAWVLYWTSRVDMLHIHLQDIREDVFSRGMPRQHAKFRQSEIMLDFRRYRYRLDAGTVANSTLLFDSVSREKQMVMWIFTGFTKGFVFLWSEHIREAIDQFNLVLPVALQQGDMVNASRIFVYRMIAHRRLGELAQVREQVHEYFHSGKFHTLNDGYADYVHGCHLWVLWMEGKYHDMQPYYDKVVFRFKPEGTSPFNFLYAYPMAAMHAEKEDYAQAVEFLRHMMFLPQRAFEDELDAWMRGITDAWEQNGALPKADALEKVVELGRRYHYI